MLKLLRADFAVLFKNRLFYICLVGMFAFGAFIGAVQVNDYFAGYSHAVQDGYPVGLLTVFFVIAAFVPWFVGTDYSDGTLRNKIVCGHSRSAIYAAHFTASLGGVLLLFAAFLLPYFALEVPFFGAKAYFFREAWIAYARSLAMIVALVALYTMIAMLCRSKAAGATASLIISVLLFGAGLYTYAMLSAPEVFTGTSLTAAGTVEAYSRPNPNYPRGVFRSVLTFFDRFLPGGQIYTIFDAQGAEFGIRMGYCGLFILLTTAVGLICFRRENLK